MYLTDLQKYCIEKEKLQVIKDYKLEQFITDLHIDFQEEIKYLPLKIKLGQMVLDTLIDIYLKG